MSAINEEYPRCNGSDCGEPCVTGYWSDGYETQIFNGYEIEYCSNGNNTTVFRFCPLCGRKLPGVLWPVSASN